MSKYYEGFVCYLKDLKQINLVSVSLLESGRLVLRKNNFKRTIKCRSDNGIMAMEVLYLKIDYPSVISFQTIINKNDKKLKLLLQQSEPILPDQCIDLVYDSWPLKELVLIAHSSHIAKSLYCSLKHIQTNNYAIKDVNHLEQWLYNQYVDVSDCHQKPVNILVAMRSFTGYRLWNSYKICHDILQSDEKLNSYITRRNLTFQMYQALYYSYVITVRPDIKILYDQYSKKNCKAKSIKYSNASRGSIALLRNFLSRSKEDILSTDYLSPVQSSSEMELQSFIEFLEITQNFKAISQETVEDMLHPFIFTKGNISHISLRLFACYLLSRESSNVTKPIHDMTQPLSSYFIASSHNTYLTGLQTHGQSSVLMYAMYGQHPLLNIAFSSQFTCLFLYYIVQFLSSYKSCYENEVLLSGCRCVEIDCWDGSDGEPIVYHGHTLTTKIKLEDVVKTISIYAFKSSDYPVILSIENHCSIPQQVKMAKYFKNIFGDSLVMNYIEEDMNFCYLPSPEVLKKRILIKHKKINDSVSPAVSLHSFLYSTTLSSPTVDSASDQNFNFDTSEAHLCHSTSQQLFGESFSPMSTAKRGVHSLERNITIHQLSSSLQRSNSLLSCNNRTRSFPFLKGESFDSSEDSYLSVSNSACELNHVLPINDSFVISHCDNVTYTHETNLYRQRQDSINILDVENDTNILKKAIDSIVENDSFVDLINEDGPDSVYSDDGNDNDIGTIGALGNYNSAANDKNDDYMPSGISASKIHELLDDEYYGQTQTQQAQFNQQSLSFIDSNYTDFSNESLSYITAATVHSKRRSVDVMKTSLSDNFVANELSELVIYTEARPFPGYKVHILLTNKTLNFSNKCTVIHSINEFTAKNTIKKHSKKLCKNLMRIYPMSMRITSTNFNPALYWIYGCQLIALNYQTNDKWMQYYTAFFQQNRSCGYVLKPQELTLSKTNQQMALSITIVSLQCPLLSYSSIPFLDVEIIGAPRDCNRLKTKCHVVRHFCGIWLKNNILSQDVMFPSLVAVKFSLTFDKDNTFSKFVTLKSLLIGYQHIYFTIGTIFDGNNLTSILINVQKTSAYSQYSNDNINAEEDNLLEKDSKCDASTLYLVSIYFLDLPGPNVENECLEILVNSTTTSSEILLAAVHKLDLSTNSSQLSDEINDENIPANNFQLFLAKKYRSSVEIVEPLDSNAVILPYIKSEEYYCLAVSLNKRKEEFSSCLCTTAAVPCDSIGTSSIIQETSTKVDSCLRKKRKNALTVVPMPPSLSVKQNLYEESSPIPHSQQKEQCISLEEMLYETEVKEELTQQKHAATSKKLLFTKKLLKKKKSVIIHESDKCTSNISKCKNEKYKQFSERRIQSCPSNIVCNLPENTKETGECMKEQSLISQSYSYSLKKL